MTDEEYNELLTALILHESMIAKSDYEVCRKYNISMQELRNLERKYSTGWVLKMYKKLKT